MKRKIINMLPASVVVSLKKLNRNIRLKKYNLSDFKRFKKSYAAVDYNKANINQLEAKLMFDTHALEKGFSHSDFRGKFGITALTNLSKTLNIYNEKNFSKNNLRYRIALSAILNYMRIHEEKNIDLSFLKTIFNNEILSEVQSADINLSGVILINSEDKVDNKNRNFMELALNRTSVREFSNKDISKEIINNVIEIALKTPSVCNRQPAKLYVIQEKKIMKQIIDIQGGYKGFGLPPVLFLITASNNIFLSPEERNEVFVDGGLFSMSILYSLEYEGIGACALNAMMNLEKENLIRAILDIPSDESLIMFIVAGYIEDEIKSPRSYRNNRESITRFF